MAFEVLELTLGLVEVADFAVRSAFGWRFLLSPRYRDATRARWATAPGRVVAVEVCGALIGMLMTGVIVVAVAASLRSRTP